MSGSAEDLGKRVLAEAEEIDLDEVLHEIRPDRHRQDGLFTFSPLDRLIQIAAEARSLPAKAQPVVELMSLYPGGGKTHLLYHLTAIATLPKTLNGRQSCVIILDTDGLFSISRLAAQTRLLITSSRIQAVNEGIFDDEELNDIVMTALTHVHLLRPQSLASTIASLDNVTAYLLNNKKHFSFDRPLAFVALDSASAFYWQEKAETEDAAFVAATTTPFPTNATQQATYGQLATSLRRTCNAFFCPGIVTTQYLGQQPTEYSSHSMQRAFRPPLSPQWNSLPTVRLIIRRVPVRKFPPGATLAQARGEGPNRLQAVMEGKFDCFVNEWNVEGRVLQRFHETGAGFEFRILRQGMIFEA